LPLMRMPLVLDGAAGSVVDGTRNNSVSNVTPWIFVVEKLKAPLRHTRIQQRFRISTSELRSRGTFEVRETLALRTDIVWKEDISASDILAIKQAGTEQMYKPAE